MADIAMPDVSAPMLSLPRLLQSSAKQTRELFSSDFAGPSGLEEPHRPLNYTFPNESFRVSAVDAADRASLSVRIQGEYKDTQELPPQLAAKQQAAAATAAARRKKHKTQAADDRTSNDRVDQLIAPSPNYKARQSSLETTQALVLSQGSERSRPPITHGPTAQRQLPSSSGALIRRDVVRQLKPDWQPPWKLMRVISGHLGWVRALAVEPDNQWFASGAGDRTIKIWDLASGHLRLTLTGHISTVRGLAVSPRHPYLFSCAEDKKVKCWDLETNKVIRDYHGHLSGVYTLALHPTLDVLMTGGRDGVVRVWDMRTRQNVHVLSGHKGTVSSVITQATDPQVISGSLDSTVRLWDLAAGKSMGVLTHHKKGVRALAQHPKEWTFASGSTSAIKQWKCPEGALMQNFEGHNAIINTLAVNEDNVLVSGGDDGSMSFWDWKTGHRFQNAASVAQPGSLGAEAGLMSMTFDQTGLRLLTGEADKTIKVWRQDENATEETHPLQWTPTLGRRHY